MTNRRGFSLIELVAAVALASALLGVATIQLRIDRLALERDARQAELEQVQNLLAGARAGDVLVPAPAGWRWERSPLDHGLEHVALVDDRGRRVATIRRRP